MSSWPGSNTTPTVLGASPRSSQEIMSGGGSSADAPATSLSNTPVLSSSTARDISSEAATLGATASQTLATTSTVTVSSQSGGIADSDTSNTSHKPLTSSAWSASTQLQGGSDMPSTQDGLLTSGRGGSLATTTMLESPSSRESSASSAVTTGTVSGSIPNDEGPMTASTPSSSQSDTTGSWGATIAGITAGTRSSESFSGSYSSTLQESTSSILSGTITESSTGTSLPGSLPHDSGQEPQGTSAGQSSVSGPTEASGPTATSDTTTLAMGSSPGDATSSQGPGLGPPASSRAGAEDSSTGNGSHSTLFGNTASSAGDFGSMLSSSTLSTIQLPLVSASDGETRPSQTATAQIPTLSTASGSLSFESDFSSIQGPASSRSLPLGQSDRGSSSNGGTMGTISAATPTSGDSEYSSGGSGPSSGLQGSGNSAMASTPPSGVWQGTGPESSFDQITSSTQLFRDSSTLVTSPDLVSQQTNSRSVNHSPAETSLSAIGTTPVPNLSETQNQFSTSVATSESGLQPTNSGRLSSEESNSNWASVSNSQESDDSAPSYTVASGIQATSASSISRIDVTTQQPTDSGTSETVKSSAITVSTPASPIRGNSTPASSISQQWSPPSAGANPTGLSPTDNSATLSINSNGNEDRSSTADFASRSEIAPSGSRSLESGAVISSDSEASSIKSDSYLSSHSSIGLGTAFSGVASVSGGEAGALPSATNYESPVSGGHDSAGSSAGSIQTAFGTHPPATAAASASSATNAGASGSSTGTGSIALGSGAVSTGLSGSHSSGFGELSTGVKSNSGDVGWQGSGPNSLGTSAGPSEGGLNTPMSTGAVASGPSGPTNLMGSTSGNVNSGSLTMQSMTSGAGSGGEENSPNTSGASSTLHAGQASSITAGPTSPATNFEPASSWSLGSHSSQFNMSPQLPTMANMSPSSMPISSLGSGGVAGPGTTKSGSVQAVSPPSSGISPGNSQQPPMTSLGTFPTGGSVSSLTQLASPNTGPFPASESSIASLSSGFGRTSSVGSIVASFNGDSSDTRGASYEPGFSNMSPHQSSYTTLPPSLSNSMSAILSSSMTFEGQDSSLGGSGAPGSVFTTSYDRSGASMMSGGATLPVEGPSTPQNTGDSLTTRSLVSNTVTEDRDMSSIYGATNVTGPLLPSSDIPDESTISGNGTETLPSLLSGSVISPGNNYQESSLTTLTRSNPSSSTERRLMTSDGSVKVSVVVSYTSTITLSVVPDQLESSNLEGPTPGLSPTPNLPGPTGNGVTMSRETATSQITASSESQVLPDDLSSLTTSPLSSSCATTLLVYIVRETTTVSWGVAQTTVTETESSQPAGYDCLLYSTMIIGDRSTTLAAGETATVTWWEPAPGLKLKQ